MCPKICCIYAEMGRTEISHVELFNKRRFKQFRRLKLLLLLLIY